MGPIASTQFTGIGGYFLDACPEAECNCEDDNAQYVNYWFTPSDGFGDIGDEVRDVRRSTLRDNEYVPQENCSKYTVICGEAIPTNERVISAEEYLLPYFTGTNASLYNQTFIKVVDDRSVNNTDPARNKIESRHVSGTNYTDILVSCLLDYGEPAGQDAVDNATNADSLYVFDELGLVSYSASGQGRLLTHVVFHPVQKSLNRLVQIDYTVRVQSLTGFNE